MRVFVFVDLDGHPVRAGQLFAESRRGRSVSAFAYDDSYVDRPGAYPVDPALPLNRGAWPVSGPLPRAFRDAAPDRWGRNLISRRAVAKARSTGQPLRSLGELDYLLGVSDASRHGALRFKCSDDGPFEHAGEDIPKTVALPALVAAARSLASDDSQGEAAVKTLLDLGSASLGGARPKATVRDGDRLMVAKFSHRHDEWNVMAWEKTALDLAAAAGIEVPRRRLVDSDGSAVLLTDRFDRTPEGHRVGYLSAMTVCEADDGDHRDYLDIAERLAILSAEPRRDLRELWRRIAFGIAINNTDDHLRNHGVVRARAGWRLSPVFDLNPDPRPGTPHVTSLAGAVTSVDAAAELRRSIEWFGLPPAEASQIVAAVLKAVGQWSPVAARNGIPPSETVRFEAAFRQGISALERVFGGSA